MWARRAAVVGVEFKTQHSASRTHCSAGDRSGMQTDRKCYAHKDATVTCLCYNSLWLCQVTNSRDAQHSIIAAITLFEQQRLRIEVLHG
jgi:hypothetical protein